MWSSIERAADEAALAAPVSDPHPDLVAVAAMVRAAGLSPPAGADVAAVRDYLSRLNAFTGRTSIPLADERRVTMAANGRDVTCKLYWPDRADEPPLMFYCHGGGFRHGSLEDWDAPLRQLVRDSQVAVLSIGYALSPEHRFPTAFKEVVSVMRTVIVQGLVDGRRTAGYAVGGDSAGANLALGAAIALRDAGVLALRHLMLLYGVYSKDLARPSWRRLGGFGGHGLSAESMATYWDSYLADGEDDWRVQPLHADLVGLPPIRLTVGDLDPLIDENVALAETLVAAGVETTLTILAGVSHGVVRFNEVAPVVREVLQAEADALRCAFTLPPRS
jgi:acetyl esterase